MFLHAHQNKNALRLPPRQHPVLIKECKYNLHQLNCRLPVQEERCGPSGNEMWVEAQMQLAKMPTRHLPTNYPEMVIGRFLLEHIDLMRKLWRRSGGWPPHIFAPAAPSVAVSGIA